MKTRSAQPVTKAEYARQELSRMIVEGELKPGDRLRLRPLAKELGLSAMPVRDALPALEAEGLVSVDEQGARVTEISAPEVLEVVSLRMWIEVLAVQNATPELAAGDLKRAKAALDAGEAAVAAGDGEAFSEENRRFHEALERPAGDLITHYVEDLWNRHWHARRDFGLFAKDARFMRQAQSEHVLLYEAVADADADRAGKIMDEHRAAAIAAWEQLLER